MRACRYGNPLLVFNSTSYSFAALTRFPCLLGNFQRHCLQAIRYFSVLQGPVISYVEEREEGGGIFQQDQDFCKQQVTPLPLFIQYPPPPRHLISLFTCFVTFIIHFTYKHKMILRNNGINQLTLKKSAYREYLVTSLSYMPCNYYNSCHIQP